jgi:hypothetical protein
LRARDSVVKLKRADLKLQNYIKTWTGKGTQDTQIPDITDADLEHSRPTPEEAQATLQAAQATQDAQVAPLTAPSAGDDAPSDGANAFSNVLVAYYVKQADGRKISDALEKNDIPYRAVRSADPEHENELSNALICGPDTPTQAIKGVALALIDAGVDVKYIGTKTSIKSRQILILNLLRRSRPVDYGNITRDQVIDLSECPSALKNE